MYQERRSRHGVRKRGSNIESLLSDPRVGFFWLMFILSRITVKNIQNDFLFAPLDYD
jgi:hypothetical protein